MDTLWLCVSRIWASIWGAVTEATQAAKSNLVYGPRPQRSMCQAPLSKTVTQKERLYYQHAHLGALNQAHSTLCNINASTVRLPMKGTAIHARKQYVFSKWTSSKLMFIWVWGQSQHISQVTNKDSLKVFIHSRVKQHFHDFGLHYEASSNDTVFHSWICINLGLWAASLWGFNDYNCTCGTISEVSKMNAVTPQGFNRMLQSGHLQQTSVEQNCMTKTWGQC